MSEGALTIPGYTADGWSVRLFTESGFLDPNKPIRDSTERELHDFLHAASTKVKVAGISLTHEDLIPRVRKSFLAMDPEAQRELSVMKPMAGFGRRPAPPRRPGARREQTMNEKELQRWKLQAQLDEWRAEADKREARAAGASADARLKLNERIEDLHGRIDGGTTTLVALAEKGEEAWASVEEKAGSARDSAKAAYDEGVSGPEPK